MESIYLPQEYDSKTDEYEFHHLKYGCAVCKIKQPLPPQNPSDLPSFNPDTDMQEFNDNLHFDPDIDPDLRLLG